MCFFCYFMMFGCPQLMLRIAALLRNFRNSTNTSNPAYLQANMLLVGVWWAKLVGSNLHVNIHYYLLLALTSFY